MKEKSGRKKHVKENKGTKTKEVAVRALPVLPESTSGVPSSAFTGPFFYWPHPCPESELFFIVGGAETLQEEVSLGVAFLSRLGAFIFFFPLHFERERRLSITGCTNFLYFTGVSTRFFRIV